MNPPNGNHFVSPAFCKMLDKQKCRVKKYNLFPRSMKNSKVFYVLLQCIIFFIPNLTSPYQTAEEVWVRGWWSAEDRGRDRRNPGVGLLEGVGRE